MHKYPFLYRQCENTFGYDDIIERLGEKRVLLPILDTHCMSNDETLFIENAFTESYNELIDFLDGNGFVIKRSDDTDIVYIIPIKKKNVPIS